MKRLCNLENAQMDLIGICKEISDKLGLKNKISYKLYHEGEYDVIYVPRFYLKAPCGCCDTLPYVYPTNIDDMVEKFKKIVYIDKKIREQIDEFSYMYTIDLLGIFNSDSNYVCNDEINNKFWNMDSDEIVQKFIDKWNTPYHFKTLDEYGYEIQRKGTWIKKFEKKGHCQIIFKDNSFIAIYEKNNIKSEKEYDIDDIDDVITMIDCMFRIENM